jgi:DNA-binding NtrC family response regulator
MNKTDKILIIDDEVGVRASLKMILKSSESLILEAENARQGLEIVKSDKVDLVLLDLRLPDMSGLEVLKQIHQIDPKLTVVMITAYGTTETIIEAIKHGAYEYLLKPFEVSTIKNIVAEALQIRRMMRHSVQLERRIFHSEEARDYLQDRIVGRSKPMQEIYKLIGQIAEREVPVLLGGESGTGKELIARAIYHHSKRANEIFIAVNCAAIPESLLESELFGYEKGAFTGADRLYIGKFERCDKGTIFLDEISDMSLSTQAKILRVIENQEIQRLGRNEPIKVDVRIIAATSVDLEKAISERRFREELYYRLNVVSIFVPPLRQRGDDIPDLIDYFFNKHRLVLNLNMTLIDQRTIDILREYDWPGNVRELENTIKKALVLGKGEILMPQHVSFIGAHKPEKPEKSEMRSTAELKSKLRMIVKDFVNQKLTPNQNREESCQSSSLHSELIGLIEELLIEEILERTGGNRSQASELLGITRPTLREKIDRYNID